MDRETRKILIWFFIPLALLLAVALPWAVISSAPGFLSAVLLVIVFVLAICGEALALRATFRWRGATSALVSTGVAIVFLAIVPALDLGPRAALAAVGGLSLVIAYNSEHRLPASKE